jgi:hypothetical protein
MAVHPRETIRKAVVALLVAAKTDAGSSVFPTREVPWRNVELPGIAVYSLEETSEQSHPQAELVRHVVLAIHAVVRLSEAVDDALDALSQQIEIAMAADPTIGRIAFMSTLVGTEISVDESTARPVGAVRLAYDVRYHTTPTVSRTAPSAG